MGSSYQLSAACRTHVHNGLSAAKQRKNTEFCCGINSIGPWSLIGYRCYVVRRKMQQLIMKLPLKYLKSCIIIFSASVTVCKYRQRFCLNIKYFQVNNIRVQVSYFRVINRSMHPKKLPSSIYLCHVFQTGFMI